MNTKLNYLYRDADNYKMPNSCVVIGEISEAQIAEVISCLDCGEYFIPQQVGLPEKRFDRFDEEVDQCWFAQHSICVWGMSFVGIPQLP